MEKFKIEGGHALHGTVRISGNKNETLPVIAACLLTDETVVLKNVPRIGDVQIMLEIIRDLGAAVEDLDQNTFSICGKNLKNKEIDAQKSAALRASILLAGPLLARFGNVVLPPPGGDVIGRRRLDTHFLIFRKLGAIIETNHNFIIKCKELIGNSIFLDETSVTATENALMAAVLAEGITILRNAACEPHIVGLATMLNAMGAKIKGAGTNIIEIEGVTELKGTTHTIGPDLLEVGSFIALAAVTRSEITLTNANPSELYVIESTYRKLGIQFASRPDKQIYIPPRQKLEIVPDFAGDIPKIDDSPWPGFPTDLMSIAIVVATQASGAVLIFEKMYDGRMFFVDYLIAMGARIVLCDPHRVVVIGPSQLFGSRVQSPDIRAGMALIIAALCARGESEIYNIRQIDRGYENLERKLHEIGARIKRLSD
jgi:UDP-N-acetylglucosamine 1-carboxyvinyltransferase